MSPPRTAVWRLEDHTRGKHEVLRQYLAAWFPIMGSFSERVLFVDGFAGPGEYEGGEPGSPVIALEAYRKYAARFKGEAIFLFIEADAERMTRLTEVLGKLPNLPGKVKLQAAPGGFAIAMSTVLGRLPPGRSLAPAFVMVDPFGVKDYPMSLIKRLLTSGKVELYISFMYEWIDRFKSTPEFETHLTELYGTDEWKAGRDLAEGPAKKDFFFGLYNRKLKEAGARHVLRFDLYRGGRLVYALFFATRHSKGSDVMKAAMWTVAPFGDFAFRGSTGSQLTLGLSPDHGPLRAALIAEFRGKEWVTIEQVQEFVASDKTPYHTGQLKTPVLVPLEKEGGLKVDSTSRQRRYAFTPGTRMRFL